MLANLINGKSSGLVQFGKDISSSTLNKITMDGLSTGASRPITCAVHDNVFPLLIQAGAL